MNPAEDEMKDEPKVIAFNKDYLLEIGYAEQPTIVIRHNDIARQHYHVLCPKVRKNGKVIRNNFNVTNWDRLKNKK